MKPTAWRGGVQVLEELEEDVRPMKRRCEENGRGTGNAIRMCKLRRTWRNEEHPSFEEGLPSLEDNFGKKAARCYKAAFGVGCDGFHSPSSARRVKRNEKIKCQLRWPQQACTTMFFLIPKNVTSERPIALLATLIRWWEWLPPLEVSTGLITGLARSCNIFSSTKRDNDTDCVLLPPSASSTSTFLYAQCPQLALHHTPAGTKPIFSNFVTPVLR